MSIHYIKELLSGQEINRLDQELQIALEDYARLWLKQRQQDVECDLHPTATLDLGHDLHVHCSQCYYSAINSGADEVNRG